MASGPVQGDPIAVTLLVPAYNEDRVLAMFLDAAIPALQPDWELLLVDDGSADRTAEIADDYARRHPAVRVVHHEENRGLGVALVTGFRNARGDVVITMDSDLSHPLDLVPQLVREAQTADVVYASRFVPGGAMVGIPRHRVLMSQTANRILRIVLHTRTHDLTTGLRAYRRSVVRDLELRSAGFAVQLEITVRLQTAGCRVAEIPLVLHNRAAGESKMRYLQLIPRYGALSLWLLWFRWSSVLRPRRRG
jgi:dolichol-phosphate mannosyltransferase